MSDSRAQATGPKDEWWLPEQLAPGSLDVFPSEHEAVDSAPVVRILIATAPLHATFVRVRHATPRLLASVAVAALVGVVAVYGSASWWEVRPDASAATPPIVTAGVPGSTSPTLLEAARLSLMAPLPTALARQTPIIASASATSAGPRIEVLAIRNVLNRYRDAMSTLSLPALRAVWPDVDVAGLEHRFAAVVDQNVEFVSCRISNSGPQARAHCAGLIESGFTPGHARPAVENVRWQFALRKVRDRWIITNVTQAPPG